MSATVKVALLQQFVVDDKATNLERTRELVVEAVQGGAQIAVLPECFNAPYGADQFAAHSEPIGDLYGEPLGPTTKMLAELASTHSIYIVGGAIPELRAEDASRALADQRPYNTCTVFDPKGQLIAKYRKVHLPDDEDATMTPGSHLGFFDTPWGKFGLGICFDVRFPELAMLAARTEGVVGMIYPGAFSLKNGPLHMETLVRARALDNQFFVAFCSTARNKSARFQCYGHSLAVDPMARIIARCQGEEEEVVVAEMRLNEIEDARSSIPVRSQRRFDVYSELKSL
ncbi:Nitrilase/cyanide hydratase and apolipo protein N-acyltransferase [Ramicandelaber brevisporus]|nr:Nitrilase/cyanide hydratase and apolipo protein N-acyltransferase [Ramicandelaber brevisporus]